MLRVFDFAVWLVLGLFVVFTFLLVYWNWNPQLKEKVASGALLVAATAFALVYSGLKEERVKKAFRVSVAVDNRTRLPLFFIDPTGSRFGERQGKFGGLSLPKVQVNGKEIAWLKPPADAGETTRLCLDLLQYVLLSEIIEIQHERVLLARVTLGQAAFEEGVYAPCRTTRTAVISTADFPIRFQQKNPFFRSPALAPLWDYRNVTLPPDLKIDLAYQPSAPGVGPERTLLILRKPLFFEATFAVVTQGSVGAPPGPLALPPELQQHVSTHTFLVEMDVRFEKYRSRHWEMDEYKRWLDCTYSELKKNLSDAG